jgi:major membrane immunogen (membrane-anchored lipoprotein)
MHGPMNIKFVDAKQAKETYQYRNIRGKLYKTNAAIWYNKI